ERAVHPAGGPALRAAPAVLPARGPEHGRQPGRALAAVHRPAGPGRAAEPHGPAVRVRGAGGPGPGELRLPGVAGGSVQAVRLPARVRRDLRSRAGRLRLLGPLRPGRGVRADPGPPAAGGVRGRQDPVPGQLRPLSQHPGGGRLVPARGRPGQLPDRLHPPGGPALRRVGRHLLHPRGPGRAVLAGGGHLRHLLPPLPDPGREPARPRPAPVRLGGRRGLRVPADPRRARPAHGAADPPAEADDAGAGGRRAGGPALLDPGQRVRRAAGGVAVGGPGGPGPGRRRAAAVPGPAGAAGRPAAGGPPGGRA
ncbi:MAG: hypothetical protein AVDCRST_MAG41-1430, partial [uncultured Corynebacteriales bacterium]